MKNWLFTNGLFLVIIFLILELQVKKVCSRAKVVLKFF